MATARGTERFDVLSYRCGAATVRVPTTVPLGSYTMTVSGDSSPVTTSNAMTFSVVA